MPAYTIQGDEGARRMQAQRDIERGEEIVSELPLLTLETGLAEIWSDEMFDDPEHQNVVEAFMRAQAALSDADRARFNRLHNNFPQEGDVMGIVRSNIWEEQHERHGHTYTIFLLYNEISRVNHSCHPNATLHWNPNTNMGSLRATREIANGDEICISYLGPRQSLLARTPRRNELRRIFGFDCNCDLCRNPGGDDALRRQARKRYDNANKDLTDYGYDGQVRFRLHAAENLVTELGFLDIRDDRLASAHNLVTDLQFRQYQIARNAAAGGLPAHNHNCLCHNNGGPVWHLDESARAWARWHGVEMVTYAPDHPQLAQTLERARDLSRTYNGQQ